jgi:hypothetical protein
VETPEKTYQRYLTHCSRPATATRRSASRSSWVLRPARESRGSFVVVVVEIVVLVVIIEVVVREVLVLVVCLVPRGQLSEPGGLTLPADALVERLLAFPPFAEINTDG